MKCEKCDYENENEAKFCNQCGSKLYEKIDVDIKENNIEFKTTTYKSSYKKKIRIGIIITFVIILGVLSYFLPKNYMVFIIAIVIVIGIILILGSFAPTHEEFHDDMCKRWMELEGLEYEDETFCKYFGGFKTVTGKDMCRMIKFKDRIRFQFAEKDSDRYEDNKDISKDRIKSYEIISEKELQEKISLGKVICFGVLALAMKNKEVVMNEYVKVDIEDNDGSIISVILKDKFTDGNNTTMKFLETVVESKYL